ncbi:CehA/McbA family metallohydrolase [Macrococcus equi]|uniref:CehA/McbA family metallohydrolase n=1 Tax=Macrococcus equi TaxID=3395462 RepID=UPI0039BDEB06
MNKLFEAEYQLNQSNNKTHVPIHIHLKGSYESITIQYKYSPVVEDNSELITEAIDDAIQQGSIDPFTSTDHLRNLITPSVRYNHAFIGANHSFEQMDIVLGKNSSVGFSPVDFKDGLLEITMSCHAIVSDNVKLTVSVFGEQCRDDIKPYHVELHSHTNHSDASFTVEALLSSAEDRGLDVLGITDHNTMTSYFAADTHDHELLILPGVEYTTFDGHFLCLGNFSRFKHQDFTRITKENIFEFLIELKFEDTLLVMAHPFDTGSPICTGCRFEYDTATHDLFDAIEVWNGDTPHTESNQKALAFYKALLKDNPTIVMTCGRDWHNENYTGTVTRMKVFAGRDANAQDIIQAVKSGQSELQFGYAISTDDILPYGLAVDICHESLKVVEDDAQIKVDSNIGYLDVSILNGCISFDERIDYDTLQWIIIEKYVDDQIVAIGNPIFNGGHAYVEKTKNG